MSTLLDEESTNFKENKKGRKELLAIGAHPINTKINQTELAAYTMVASTIMNFDEFHIP